MSAAASPQACDMAEVQDCLVAASQAIADDNLGEAQSLIREALRGMAR